MTVRPDPLEMPDIVYFVEKMFFLFSRLGTPSSITILRTANLPMPNHDSPVITFSPNDFAVGSKVLMRWVNSSLLWFFLPAWRFAN